jgi:hypothetical protein
MSYLELAKQTRLPQHVTSSICVEVVPEAATQTEQALMPAEMAREDGSGTKPVILRRSEIIRLFAVAVTRVSARHRSCRRQPHGKG